VEPKIVQQQTQKQILSPQIRQYLKLLQMPVVELSQAVEQELAENPVLEESSQDLSSEEDVVPSAEAGPAEKVAQEIEFENPAENRRETEEEFWSSYDYSDVSAADPGDLQKRKNYQESLLTKPEALSDFLLWQIRFQDFTEAEMKIAEEIIGNINEEGYLKATVEEIAGSCKAAVPEVEAVLQRIQQLDPPGIGARNLQEALLLQLQRKGPEAALALEIVEHHLPLLERKDWQQLAKILATNELEVKKAAQMIVALEPKPGRTFYVEEPIAVTPDAAIVFDEEGKIKIEIQDENIPELRVNPYYRRLLRDSHTDEKTKVYLREKMQAALNFMRALKLRKSTLREITEQIVKVQPEFFEKGFSHLHPLRLKDISQTLGIHESTVSRALQGKYVTTPQGTIPYKSFFSTKMETTSGEAESQKSIMERIRALVESEDPKKPLSDEQIVKTLQGDGIVIARRTVAKYRDLLKILPSHLRRQR
jgi:RNA polymerase sigma-54 factor